MLRNQNGSVIIVSLLLGLTISAAAGSFIWYLNSQNKQLSRGRIKEDSVNLGISIKMLYSQDKNCVQNLSAQGWGTTLQELKTRSQSGSIKMLYPMSGPAAGVFLSTNGSAQRAVVKSISFENITLVNSLDSTAYRMDLRVALSDGAGFTLKPLTIPFYVVADSSDKLVSCFATSYPFSNAETAAEQNTTMEDFLCSQFYETDAIYTPSGKTCLQKPALVGAK